MDADRLKNIVDECRDTEPFDRTPEQEAIVLLAGDSFDTLTHALKELAELSGELDI